MERMTREIGPELPEKLLFSGDEATLSLRAIAYHAHTGLQTVEANWDVEALRAMHYTAETATKEVDRIAAFVGTHQTLVGKFNDALINPGEAVKLVPDELEVLGDALYCIGNSGFTQARNAIASGDIGFASVKHRSEVLEYTEQTTTEAYELYKKLEPIARSKPTIMWMTWEQLVPESA